MLIVSDQGDLDVVSKLTNMERALKDFRHGGSLLFQPDPIETLSRRKRGSGMLQLVFLCPGCG